MKHIKKFNESWLDSVKDFGREKFGIGQDKFEQATFEFIEKINELRKKGYNFTKPIDTFVRSKSPIKHTDTFRNLTLYAGTFRENNLRLVIELFPNFSNKDCRVHIRKIFKPTQPVRQYTTDIIDETLLIDGNFTNNLINLIEIHLS